MTENDVLVLKALGTGPPADIHAARLSWEDYAQRLNCDLPAIGALHENVELGGGLQADIAVPAGSGLSVVHYLHGGGWASAAPRVFASWHGLPRRVTWPSPSTSAWRRNIPSRPASTMSTCGDWIRSQRCILRGDGNRIAIRSVMVSAGAIWRWRRHGGVAERRARLAALLLFYGVYDLTAALERTNQHRVWCSRSAAMSARTIIRQPCPIPWSARCRPMRAAATLAYFSKGAPTHSRPVKRSRWQPPWTRLGGA